MFEQPLYVKVGTWFATLLPAIVGSAISLRLSAENASYWSRLFSFLFGVALAHFVGGAIVDSFGINKDTMVDEAVILASGIFGMTTATELTKQIPEIAKGLTERIVKFFQK